ncbi:hypothetical protein HDU96_008012 [Phlyctochytrium bullatum]|nr:hypothetical protein HDU96_008012 [Phlyctochytrium bullatum]
MPDKIRSSDAGPATVLTFVNKTPSTLDIFWIDTDGNSTKYHSVEPNRFAKQPTYANHAWEIVNASTSKSLATHLAQEDPQTLTIRPHAPPIITPSRTVRQGPETFIKLINASFSTVNVYWVDRNGDDICYRTLEPQSSHTQQTYANHVWNFVEQDTGKLIGYHIASPVHQTLVLNGENDFDIHRTATPMKSLGSGEDTVLTIVNRTGEDVEMFWVDWDGMETLYETLKNDQTFEQQTFATHAWKFVGVDSGKVIGYHRAIEQKQTLTLKGEDIIEVTVTSSSAPATEVESSDADVNSAATPLKSTGSGPETFLTFVNRTGENVEVFWVDWEGKEISYLNLNNDQIYKQQTYATHAWKFVGVDSGKVIGYHRAVEERQILTLKGESVIQVKVPGSSPPPLPGFIPSDAHNPETYLKIFNCTGEDVEIFWVDWEGKETRYETLKDNPTYDRDVQTYATHEWKFVGVNSGKVIGSYRAVENKQTLKLNGEDDIEVTVAESSNAILDSQDVIAPIKTKYDGPQTFVTFSNASPSTIVAYLIDKEGKQSVFVTMEQGSAVKTVQTNGGYAWKFAVKDTGKLVGYHITSPARQTVILKGENDLKVQPNIRSIGSSNEITLTLLNRSGEDVDVIWLDGEGSEVKYTTVGKDQSYDQPSFTNHVWKFVGVDSGELFGYHRAMGERQTLTLNGKNSIDITFHGSSDTTWHTVQAAWVSVKENKTPYLVLAPGQPKSENTSDKRDWKLPDGTTVVGHQPATPYALTLPEPAAAAAEPSRLNAAAAAIGKTFGYIKDVTVAAFTKRDDGEGTKEIVVKVTAENESEVEVTAEKESVAKVTAEQETVVKVTAEKESVVKVKASELFKSAVEWGASVFGKKGPQQVQQPQPEPEQQPEHQAEQPSEQSVQQPEPQPEPQLEKQPDPQVEKLSDQKQEE